MNLSDLGIADEKETTYRLKSSPILGDGYTVEKFADWITLQGAEPIAEYAEPHLEAFAAVTRHQHGMGVGWYVGAIVREQQFYDAVVARLLADAKISPIVHLPLGVEAAIRGGNDREFLFLVNHSDSEQRVTVPAGRPELLTATKTTDTLVLAGFGIAVIEL